MLLDIFIHLIQNQNYLLSFMDGILFVLLQEFLLIHKLFLTLHWLANSWESLLLSVCVHVWISKQVDCTSTHDSHFSQIWPILCHLFFFMQTDLKSIPATPFCTRHTHICVNFQCFLIPIVCSVLMMIVHIYYPIKSLISCYCVSDLTII